MTASLYAAYIAGWQAHRFCAPIWSLEKCWQIDRKYLASAIEAQRAETAQTDSVADESAVATAETPNLSPGA